MDFRSIWKRAAWTNKQQKNKNKKWWHHYIEWKKNMSLIQRTSSSKSSLPFLAHCLNPLFSFYCCLKQTKESVRIMCWWIETESMWRGKTKKSWCFRIYAGSIFHFFIRVKICGLNKGIWWQKVSMKRTYADLRKWEDWPALKEQRDALTKKKEFKKKMKNSQAWLNLLGKLNYFLYYLHCLYTDCFNHCVFNSSSGIY